MCAFKKPNPKQSFPELETALVSEWKKNQVFRRSVRERSKEKEFTFYDGPPFATGTPHYGHIVGQVMKDMVPRYWTMKGYRVERRWGWDCHGVPIEMQKEKELHLDGKHEIEEYGVDRFNESCRSTILQYAAEWRVMIDRLGRFVDMDDDYKTMEPWYMESIWWVFKELWKKDLVYLGKKVVPFSYRMSCPLSNFEAQQNYQDRQDPAVTVKFRADGFAHTNNDPIYFLAWTTTPWTLPSNLLLAVGPEVDYVLIKDKETKEQYILGHEALKKYYKDEEEPGYEVLHRYKGSELGGIHYEPLFPYFEAKKSEGAFQVEVADFVTTEDGTGIVHLAPYGEEDFAIIQAKGIEIVDPVHEDGTFTNEVEDFEGVLVFDANKPIIDKLKEMRVLVKQETINHSYPHCWRTDTPLLYKPIESWFVKVTAIKKDLVANNQKINWVPGHVRDGRFGKWLENARDWAISRNRFWGTPLPIWRTKDGSETKVIGSIEELYNLTEDRLTKVTLMRHGESEVNVNKMWSDNREDFPLTDKGRNMVKDFAGRHLTKPDIILTSPLLRTKQTSELLKEVFQGGVEIEVEERLAEMKFGAWEGKTTDSEEVAKGMEQFRLLYGSEEHFTTPRAEGAESFADLAGRLKPLVEEIQEKYRGKSVMLVAHGAVLRTLELLLRGLPGKRIGTLEELNIGTGKTIYMDALTKQEFDLHKHHVDGVTFPNEAGTELMYRVPEVFDCWFESGSMPYAQNHFPFENEAKTAKNFPADFIAEGPDQTRGWFYTLNVLATALSDGKSGLGMYQPAFKNCIVNGIVLAEDGKKMSKRLKNYPDPSLIMEKYGADAMRFYLMNSPVVKLENLRFSERGVEEVVKKVLLPLWNSYSFFVTYANVDGWDPSKKDLSAVEHKLDRWMLSSLYKLEQAYHTTMEQYDLKEVTTLLLEFLDGLTNWYIRRSRRRFWKSENDQDKFAAYSTLHEVLLRFAKMLAPVCPFITDHMFMNLTQSEESIHLNLFEEAPKEWFDESLDEEMEITRRIVKLGHNIRAKEKVKVRQPLSKVEVAFPEGFDTSLLSEQVPVICEELNVKQLVMVENPEELGTAFAKPDARVLGPRLGRRVQEVIKEAKAGNFERLEDGGIKVLDVILEPHEVELGYQSKEGKSADSEQGMVVALDIEITPELAMEGQARDMIRVIQDLRKEKDLDVADRIIISLSGNLQEGARNMLDQFGDMIRKETLAEEITFSGDTPAGGKPLELDGEVLTLGVEPISS